MGTLPRLDVRTNINHSPHVVLLGAGASKAALPNGDVSGKKLPVMKNMVSVLGLEDALADFGFTDEIEDFERFYSDLCKQEDHDKLRKTIEDEVHRYFSSIRLPDSPTIYDYLVLSLRSTDLIATFNWDPLLAQAFKRNREVTRLPRISFLHGNVEVGVCREHEKVGFIDQSCDVCGMPLSPSKLLYPVGEKDYQSDPYIKSEWDGLADFLNEAYFVTIFGYSAPVTDLEAKKLLLEAWQNNSTKELAEIDVIDIRLREDIEETWKEFFVRAHYAVWTTFENCQLFRHPRRSCDAFAMATLQQKPWDDNTWPKFDRLEDLHAWVSPLLEEEQNGYFSGKPCDL